MRYAASILGGVLLVVALVPAGVSAQTSSPGLVSASATHSTCGGEHACATVGRPHARPLYARRTTLHRRKVARDV